MRILLLAAYKNIGGYFFSSNTQLFSFFFIVEPIHMCSNFIFDTHVVYLQLIILLVKDVILVDGEACDFVHLKINELMMMFDTMSVRLTGLREG
jgi:hypothetical protein